MPDFKVEIRARLAKVGLSPMREDEIVEELSQHLEDEYERALSCGTSEEQARQQSSISSTLISYTAISNT
jgi:hypothetical protein